MGLSTSTALSSTGGLWRGVSGLWGGASGLVRAAGGIGPAIAYLPTLASAPLAVYSPSRVAVSGYTGPLCRVRRASDNAEQDVSAASGSAYPDWAAVQTWAGASTFFCTTIYDQRGSANHVVQATAAAQFAFDMDRLRGPYLAPYSSVNRFMTIPAAITGDGRNVTGISVQHRLGNGSGGNTNLSGWMIGAAWNTAGALSLLGIAPRGVRVLTSTTFLNTEKLARSQPELMTLRSSGTAITALRDGVATALPVNNAGTWAGGTIGRGGVTYNFEGSTDFWAVYPSALSDGDMATLRTALNGMYAITPLENTALPLVVGVGNSIVLGTGATNGRNNQFYAEGLLTRPVHWMGAAIFGQTAATAYADRAQYFDEYDAARPVNIILAPEPTNDIAGSTTGTDAWNNSVKLFVDTAVAAGFKVILPTTIKRPPFDATRQGFINDYNTLARAYANGTNIILCDYAMDDASLTLPDNVHPNSASYAIMAARLAAAIDSATA